jgi:hypothetical protein
VRCDDSVQQRTAIPEKHPDKTFIGRIERGFDLLGYRFGATVLKLAEATIRRTGIPAWWVPTNLVG